MKTAKSCSHVVALFLAIGACPMACSSGSPGGGQDGGPDSGADAASNADSSSSDGASSDGASSADSSNSDGSGETTYTLPAGDCFTLATASKQPYTTACGDFMALTGNNVDLQSGAGSSQLCLLSGTYSSLSAVPTSYASCTWTSNIDGTLNNLTNAGVIVLDATGTHHYRMRVLSNTLPALVFSFADID